MGRSFPFQLCTAKVEGDVKILLDIDHMPAESKTDDLGKSL